MGMHSEIIAGMQADRLARTMLEAFEQEETSTARKVVQYLMPLYEGELGEAWGCHDNALEQQLRQHLRED